MCLLLWFPLLWYYNRVGLVASVLKKSPSLHCNCKCRSVKLWCAPLFILQYLRRRCHTLLVLSVVESWSWLDFVLTWIFWPACATAGKVDIHDMSNHDSLRPKKHVHGLMYRIWFMPFTPCYGVAMDAMCSFGSIIYKEKCPNIIWTAQISRPPDCFQ